ASVGIRLPPGRAGRWAPTHYAATAEIQADLVVFTLVVTVSPTVAPTVVPLAVPVGPPVDPSGPVDACRCVPPRAADADTGICWRLSRSGDREHQRHCHRAQSHRRLSEDS